MAKNYRAELVGAFGNPIDENPTGVMEEAAFAAKGLNYRYLTVKVEKDDLEAAMNGVKAFNMRGINLTIPHKVRVLQYLDELSEAASIIGAVNTVSYTHLRGNQSFSFHRFLLLYQISPPKIIKTAGSTTVTAALSVLTPAAVMVK